MFGGTAPVGPTARPNPVKRRQAMLLPNLLRIASMRTARAPITRITPMASTITSAAANGARHRASHAGPPEVPCHATAQSDLRRRAVFLIRPRNGRTHASVRPHPKHLRKPTRLAQMRNRERPRAPNANRVQSSQHATPIRHCRRNDSTALLVLNRHARFWHTPRRNPSKSSTCRRSRRSKRAYWTTAQILSRIPSKTPTRSSHSNNVRPPRRQSHNQTRRTAVRPNDRARHRTRRIQNGLNAR